MHRSHSYFLIKLFISHSVTPYPVEHSSATLRVVMFQFAQLESSKGVLSSFLASQPSSFPRQQEIKPLQYHTQNHLAYPPWSFSLRSVPFSPNYCTRKLVMRSFLSGKISSLSRSDSFIMIVFLYLTSQHSQARMNIPSQSKVLACIRFSDVWIYILCLKGVLFPLRLLHLLMLLLRSDYIGIIC